MGGTTYLPGTGYYGSTASNEVWELDPVRHVHRSLGGA
jgi:hypothetical protein